MLAFRAQFGETSLLDELVRKGAERNLQFAIEMEVNEFLAAHAMRRDALDALLGHCHQLAANLHLFHKSVKLIRANFKAASMKIGE
ncbi:MAG: hypothetical protein IT427_05660 [Pirellulales bacterium]|nr:hypothetical protein [Pirellulales bacterium]